LRYINSFSYFFNRLGRYWIVIYKTVKVFIDENKALLCCFILFTCKGFFGGHTARSGDFDALLTLFLLLSIYHFLQYLINKKEDSIVYFFLFTGLAFITKGPSCLLFLPTIILFILLNKQKHTIIINRKFIYGIFIFLFFPLLYFIIQIKYGITSEITDGITNTNSSLGTLFLYDTIHRITGSRTFTEHTWDAFIVYLDVYFFIWYIFFYCTIILFIYKRLKLNNQLVLFSVLSIATIGVFFTFMANQKHWYLMPLFPFIAIVTAYGISFLINYNKWMFIPVISVAIISLTTQYFYLNEKKLPPRLISTNTDLLKNAKYINCIGINKQEVMCYLYFLNDNLNFPQNNDIIKEGIIIVDRESHISYSGETIYQDDHYSIIIAN
jgi:4-amino-4-deoxy-L-arabinose transferase-like glycosyltransferase